MRWRRAAPLVSLISDAAAPIETSLPLDGYYRPGKYIPIRFRAYSEAAISQTLEFSADSAVPTRLLLSEGNGQGIAPLLLIGSNRQIVWRKSSVSGRIEPPLKSVGEGQRL